MADMSAYAGKKEFPSQTENRRQWILDTIREHQITVAVLMSAAVKGKYGECRNLLRGLHVMDRDALMQPGGVLTDDQIKEIGEV